MSEAIRDRRPTEADACEMGRVLVWHCGRWREMHFKSGVAEDSETWWKPIDQTPPPEPEETKEEHLIDWAHGIMCNVDGGTESQSEEWRTAFRLWREKAGYETPPPEPEKPKRKKRIHHNNAGEVCDVWLEVLPGDPPDLDEFLEAVDRLLPRLCKEGLEANRVRAARHGEGGDA